MQIKKVKVSQLKTNDANPRYITSEKFEKLVDSILSLPKMLEIRPIVVTDELVALGGNMRCQALAKIAAMSVTELTAQLNSIPSLGRKEASEVEALHQHWQEWQQNPTAGVLLASELSEDEQREFVIKDNVAFGQWDWDVLANSWNEELLQDWGMDIPSIIGDTSLDEFFDEESGHEAKDKDKHTIVLQYTMEEYELVCAELEKIAKNHEDAVWKLLNLDK